jgi:hypothetical protein
MAQDVAGVGMNVDLLDRCVVRPELALNIHDVSFAE